MAHDIDNRNLLVATIVFLDLETTAIHRNPRITELALLAVDRFSLETAEPNKLRIIDKLILSFHPRVPFEPGAAKVSKIEKSDYFHKKDFDEDAFHMIELFFKRLDPPLMMIAHNGFSFDFPILKAELNRINLEFQLLDCKGDPVYCADSKRMFNRLYNELPIFNYNLNDSGLYVENDTSNLENSISKEKSKKSLRLVDLYAKVFGNEQPNAHSAEADCLAILNLMLTIPFSSPMWLDSNFIEFNNDVKARYDSTKESDLKPLNRGEFPYTIRDNNFSIQNIPSLSRISINETD